MRHPARAAQAVEVDGQDPAPGLRGVGAGLWMIERRDIHAMVLANAVP